MNLFHPPAHGAARATPRRRAGHRWACSLALAAAAAGAWAQPAEPEARGGGLGLGLAVIDSQKPYRGMERETRALPLIRYENEYVKVGGLGLELKLPGLDLGSAGRLRFGLVGRFDLSGYEAEDAPILAGMAERKGGFWAGGRAEWAGSLGELHAQWTADTSGHSKGQRFTLGFEKGWRIAPQVVLVPHASAHWLDRKYVDYYYGVPVQEAVAGRPAYAGKSGINVELGLRTLYLIDRQHSLLLDLSATRLASSIRDSPLVDRSRSDRILLGYTYQFR